MRACVNACVPRKRGRNSTSLASLLYFEGEGEGESIILPLLLIPSWALAIAYRLPIACLSIAYRHGPGLRAQGPKAAIPHV